MNNVNGLPEAVLNTIAKIAPGAEIKLSETSDLGPGNLFGERWIALAGEQLIVCEPDGVAPRVTIALPLKDISDIQIENLVGNSVLQAVVKGRALDLIPFTNALAARFGRLRGQLDAMVKGKPVPEMPIKENRCPICGLMLRENTRVCPRCMRKGATFLRLLRYARPYRWGLVLICLLMVIATAFATLPPYLNMILVDKVLVPHRNGHLILPLIFALLMSSLLSALLSIWRGRLGAWIGARVTFDIRAQLYEHLQWLSMRYFDRHPTGALISRLTQDSGGVQDLLAFSLPRAVNDILSVLGVAMAVFVINWKLALIALLPTPLVSLMTATLWRLVRRIYHRYWRGWSRFYSLVNDALSRVKIIKAFSQQPMEIDRFQIRNAELTNASIHVEQTYATISPFVGFVMGSGSLLVWYFGGWAVFRSDPGFTLGSLIAFLAYLGMFLYPLTDLLMSVQWMSRAFTAAERIFEVLDAESDSEQKIGTVIPEQIKGEVEYRNVVFGYEKHHPVLKDISFKVKPGEMLGLVGKSGQGKSTIINLLCRFYDLDEGDILIDGINLRDLDLSAYRGKLGAVLQDPFLFSGTVAENIAYGKPTASIEEIMAAAKVANAHDFIVNKPDGYDEQVGEHGARLSGGEKQRVCIARAILHDPAILILDEATANVDLETESQIQQAVARLIENRTTFCIAHRLSTLRNAHHLLVIEDGKIVEFGTHEELEEKQGVYKRLLEIHEKTSMVKAVD